MHILAPARDSLLRRLLAPGRVTYIIGQQGAARSIFNSRALATLHVSEAPRVLREMPTE